MRRCLALILILAGGWAAFGSDDALLARFHLAQAYPGVIFDGRGQELSRIYGVPFGFGMSPEETADTFVQSHAAMFGVDPAELVPGNWFNSLYTQPVMYDAETGHYKFTLVYYMQTRDGLPVFRSGLRLLVLNEPGYPLVWAGATLRDLGAFRVPAGVAAALAEGAAHASAIAAVPGLSNFSASELVVWPDTDGQPRSPRAALTFIADNGQPATPNYERWRFVADAFDGTILYQESLILNTDVTGTVHGMATTIPKADVCNPEVDTPMPYARVAIGSTNVYANASGDFVIPNGDTAPVTVTSYMSGQYFNVSDQGGSLETLTLTVTPPGPANFMHNQANTNEFIRAQVNAYVQANIVRDFTLAQNPAYPTIHNQTGFQLKVNINSTCNAYYDGSSLNFYRQGGGCANSAYSNVVHHEYGHHMVECGGSGQDAYGEGMGDCVAMLIADDPVLGYGFQLNCNAGIRTADNTMQYPCSGEIHECGQLLSGCVWSTRNQLIVTNPSTYRQILNNLTVNSILLHDGGAITPQICVDFLTLDDDNGDITDGTPHFAEITTGFAAHNMWQGLPPQNDSCSNAPLVCNSTYSGTTSGKTVDGSASCGNSNSTPDAWYKYIPTASGTLTLELCDSDYDTVLSVHTACPGTSGNQVGCNDDTGWFGACGWLPTSQSALELSVTAGTTYLIRISGSGGATGTYVLYVSGPACTPPDSTPPTPNPMTFAVPPAPISATAISMTATTASDATSPPVQYEFDFVSGGPGGADSGWQSGTQYTNNGLTPNTAYTYRVRARDSASPPNANTYSANATATTWANIPAAPTLSDPTTTTMQLDVNPNGNPANTTFAVRCTATTDGAWHGMYVNASGQPSATAVWLTDAQWGTLTITGLQPGTDYTFAVKARNSDNVETAFGPSATLATLTGILYGDLNCDGEVGFGDINPFVAYVTSCASWQTSYPGCPPENGDINANGQHACNGYPFDDINAFVALLSGGQ